MNENDIGSQWRKLCEEHEAARDAYLRAFTAVNQRFSTIGKGTPNVNPTNAELTEFEKARHAWHDIMRRMGEFVKKYAEKSGQRLGWPAELGR
jgi:hypothetical protein